MNIDELLQILDTSRGFSLTPEQEAIVRHPNGPAWVLAGPGTGKTEVLTVMLMRLLYVNQDPIQTDRVAPESIFVTTFTEKAARNLGDRLASMRSYIIAADPSLGLSIRPSCASTPCMGFATNCFRNTGHQTTRMYV